MKLARSWIGPPCLTRRVPRVFRLKRPIYQDRRPRLPMGAGDLVDLLRDIDAAGIGIWLDGGWGVDALLGEQRREHDDVDLIPDLAEMPRLLEVLERRGYQLVDGELPASLVLHDAVGRQVDIHPVAFNERGDGIYRMQNGEDWIYPAWGFAGRGRVLDLEVRCLTPEAQVLCHAGYELDEDDVGDLQALRERFGVTAPGSSRE